MRKWFVIVASVVIVLILVRAAGFREVGDAWKAVETRGILLAIACYGAAFAVRVLSWRLLLAPDAPPFGALVSPLALGFLLGHLSPAKSGEPAASLLVARTFGLRLPRTLSVLTAERALQLLLLLATFVPASLVYAGEILEIRGTALAAGALLLLSGLGVAFAAPGLRRLAPLAVRVPRVGRSVAEYVEALAALLASRRLVVPLLGLGTLYWLFQYLSLWAILDAGGLAVNLVGAAVVAGSAILGGTLTMLPLGTQDGISAVVLAGLGVPLALGFSLALFHTVLSLACGLVLVVAAAIFGGRGAPR